MIRYLIAAIGVGLALMVAGVAILHGLGPALLTAGCSLVTVSVIALLFTESDL